MTCRVHVKEISCMWAEWAVRNSPIAVMAESAVCPQVAKKRAMLCGRRIGKMLLVRFAIIASSRSETTPVRTESALRRRLAQARLMVSFWQTRSKLSSSFFIVPIPPTVSVTQASLAASPCQRSKPGPDPVERPEHCRSFFQHPTRSVCFGPRTRRVAMRFCRPALFRSPKRRLNNKSNAEFNVRFSGLDVHGRLGGLPSKSPEYGQPAVTTWRERRLTGIVMLYHFQAATGVRG